VPACFRGCSRRSARRRRARTRVAASAADACRPPRRDHDRCTRACQPP
jgi:hypothetical protein